MTAERRKIVDRLGQLDAKLAPALAKLKPEIEEQKKLREQVTSWAKDEAAESSLTYQGEQYTAIASPRTNEKTPNIPKLVKRLTLKVVLEICTIAIKELIAPGRLSEAELPEYVTTERTGYRTIKTVAKVAKAA